MSGKVHKIKKNKGFVSTWSKLTWVERVALLVLVAALIASAAYIIFGPKTEIIKNVPVEFTPERLQEIMTCEGEWDVFPDFGVQVWTPTDIAEEQLGEDKSFYQRLFATRDKGHSPEIAFGVFIVPDVQSHVYNIAEDPGFVIGGISDKLREVIGECVNGVQTSIAVDVGQETLETGDIVLTGFGDAEVICLYRNPKNPEEVYTEPLALRLFYSVATIEGRPVVCWGIWDWSTYKGEERTRAYVMSAVTSLIEAEGYSVIDPGVVVTGAGQSYVDPNPQITYTPSENTVPYEGDKVTEDSDTTGNEETLESPGENTEEENTYEQ